MISRQLLLAGLIALGSPVAGFANPQSYPDRPIRLIVPFPPGGPTDYVARLVAQHVSAKLGQVVLDNRPGAGGTIASKAVANAEPDGYTLLYGSSATLGIAPALYKNVEYDPIKSFAPVALVSRVPFVLGVAAAVPANTLGEFIAYAKANPGKLNFGATIGTPPHLVGELFKFTTGVDILYVPYKGAAQAMTDLLAGQMHLTIEGATTLLAHIQSGKVRPLAVMSPQRIPALPDVPTMLESGYSGFPSASWTECARACRHRSWASSMRPSTMPCSRRRSARTSPGSARRLRSDPRRTSPPSLRSKPRNGPPWSGTRGRSSISRHPRSSHRLTCAAPYPRPYRRRPVLSKADFVPGSPDSTFTPHLIFND